MREHYRLEGLGGKFFKGLFWLFVSAVPLSMLTGHSIPVMLAMLFVGSLFCAGLVLWWMTLWASRRESRLGQFGIGSLLFVTLFVAMFLGFVRWLVSEGKAYGTVAAGEEDMAFLIIAPAFLIWSGVSLGILPGMVEAVLWGAVWFLKRPVVRRWFRRKRKNSEPAEDP